MSINHHSAEEDAARDRLLDHVLGRAVRNHPDGRLSREDDGELAFAIAADKENQVVILNFGKSVKWVGFPKKQAVALAEMLLARASELT